MFIKLHSAAHFLFLRMQHAESVELRGEKNSFEPKQRLLFCQSVRRNNKRVEIYFVWNKYSDNFTALTYRYLVCYLVFQRGSSKQEPHSRFAGQVRTKADEQGRERTKCRWKTSGTSR